MPSSGLSLLGVNLSGSEYGNAASGRLGTDYTYPTHAEIDYLASKHLNIARIPFLWERLQPTENGPLNQTELSNIDDLVSYANSKGIKVILDPHNYGYGYGNLVGSAGTPSSAFADFWGKMATHFAASPNVLFGLMNEPHDQTATQWLDSANAAITAIRAAGATQEILVPGTNWDGGWTWTTSDNASVIGANIQDPAHNTAFEVHQYLDSDGSGTHSNVVSTSVGADRLAAVTNWAETTGNKLFLGEFGVASDQTSLTAMGNMLGYMDQHTDVWQGATYWTGGPWMGTYMYSIEPSSGVDKPQMGVLLADGTPSTTAPPVANNDSGLAATENTPLSIAASVLLANDTDPNGETLTITGVSNPSHGTVTLNTQSEAGTQSVQFTPTTGYTGPAGFTYSITDSSGGVASANVSLEVDAPPPPPPPNSLNILGDGVPVNVNDSDTTPAELGVKFQSSEDGTVTGIRFYKGSQNTGTHTGELWDSNGNELATATFTNETASGWQDVSFSSPVSISPNTTYIASYHESDGHYSGDNNYFTAAHTNGPLTALDDGTSGGNGVYAYAAGSAFPTGSYQASNYWVDVDFNPAPSSVNLFGNTTPGTINTQDTQAAELGVKFQSSEDGTVTGVRFYKGSQNVGTHTGELWDSSGNELATATFTSETDSGWQDVKFSSPVAISANTTYVASYHESDGYYSSDHNYFTAAHTNGPLTALADGVNGGDGVYAYAGNSVFPTTSYLSSNYWVDVDFTPSASPPPPPPPPPAAPDDTLVLNLSEDYYNGNAIAQLYVDGNPYGSGITVSASHAAGNVQHTDISLASIAAGTHTIGVQFTNDLYGGSSSTDRNLYVDPIQIAPTSGSEVTGGTTTYGSGTIALLSTGDMATFNNVLISH